MSSAKCVFGRSSPAVAVVVAGGDTHAGLRAAVLAVGGAALHGYVCERAVVVVAVEDGRRRVGGNVDVRPAVVGQVGGDGRHGIASGDARDARPLRDIDEHTVALVVIEEVGVGRKPLGTAIDWDAFPEAVRTLTRFSRRREIEPQVVGDEQIEPPVAIVVHERAARSPADSGVARPAAAVASSNRPSPRLR